MEKIKEAAIDGTCEGKDVHGWKVEDSRVSIRSVHIDMVKITILTILTILVRDRGILSSRNSPTNAASVGATEGATRKSLFATTGYFNAFAFCFSLPVELAPVEMIRNLAAE